MFNNHKLGPWAPLKINPLKIVEILEQVSKEIYDE